MARSPTARKGFTVIRGSGALRHKHDDRPGAPLLGTVDDWTVRYQPSGELSENEEDVAAWLCTMGMRPLSECRRALLWMKPNLRRSGNLIQDLAGLGVRWPDLPLDFWTRLSADLERRRSQ